MDESSWINWFQDPNAFWVLCGTTLLGIISGVIGSFAYLRKRGLMGDVLAHAALPGICLAFMITGSKHSLTFLIGAAITGLIASLIINALVRYSRIKEDTALALVLSLFFGFGIVLLTQIQHSHNGNQSGLDQILFGQAASMLESDLITLGTVAIILLILCILLFKEFKLLCFDASFAHSLGFPVKKLDFLLMALLVTTVVAGLQTAGVVLMAALLIIPAASARYWTDQLNLLVILSGFIGAVCGILGTFISSLGYHLSTGPLIVLAASTLFLISMIFGPKRGLLRKWIRFLKTKQQVQLEQGLIYLYEWMEQAPQPKLSLQTIQNRFPSKKMATSVLKRLQKKKWIKLYTQDGDTWVTFTTSGLEKAYETVLFHRMLEVWQMHEGELGSPVTLSEIEHRDEIPKSLLPKLMQLLKQHHFMPRPLDPIPDTERGNYG